MIIAKNQLAHSILSESNIEKKYLALVEGELKGEGEINAKIDREDNSIIKRCVRDSGKEAITKYKVIKNYKDYTLVELTLLTGRTHQIRVHMAYIGHPLLGDGIYNLKNPVGVLEDGRKIERQALHASHLKFEHPILKKEIEIDSKPDFID